MSGNGRRWFPIDEEAFKELYGNAKLLAFYAWACGKATQREYSQVVGNQKVHLFPGQFVMGRSMAARETGLSEREIRTCLQSLKNCDFLTTKSTNKFSVISLMRRASMRDSTPSLDQQSTSNRPQTRKENKELKPKTPAGSPGEAPHLPSREEIPDHNKSTFHQKHSEGQTREQPHEEQPTKSRTSDLQEQVMIFKAGLKGIRDWLKGMYGVDLDVELKGGHIEELVKVCEVQAYIAGIRFVLEQNPGHCFRTVSDIIGAAKDELVRRGMSLKFANAKFTRLPYAVLSARVES